MIYVDTQIDYGWKLGPSCHMYADTQHELHTFAAKLGLKQSWFQNKRVPHYDLVVSKRIKAVKLGAVEHTLREAMAFWIKQGWYPARHLGGMK